MAVNYLLFFLLSLLISSLTITTSQTEQQILLQIKKEFRNPPSLSSWTTSAPYCNWTGIQCTDGSVTGISLSDQNITYAIPDTVCNLSNLSYIDLSWNYLPGTFPTSLYKCNNLQHLDLSQNLFVGSIPSTINQLSDKLYHLSLSANNFTGDVPSSIGQLSALQYLLLDNNLFNGTYPAELGNLSNLEYLWLANNPFAPSQIPDEFGNMSSLSFLWMASSKLYGVIPDTFEKLQNLVQLDLSMNSLTGRIPKGIWMLRKIEKIFLYYNKLSGEIGDTIEANNLIKIDLSMNNLTGSIPEGFGKLQNLTTLFLYYNQISGEIPAEFGLLHSLTDLRLFNNKLTGILPSELGKHSNLWNLEVDDNSLSGELPQFLCSRGNFTSLVVSNNNFSGNLPSSLATCNTLNNLMVQNNSLDGEVPDGLWSTADNLTTVLMHHNSFSGKLPDELPSNLTRLEIQSNRFSGNIPSTAQKLTVFKASKNLLNGTIPENIGNFSGLQILYLDDNQLSGEIPSSISSLRFLTQLNLSSNRLSGDIPADIGSLPVLNILDLSDNQLGGSIPASMGNMNLNILNLSSNDLSGEVPNQLQNQAYDNSFVSNPNLCSLNPRMNIRVCRGKSSGSANLSTGLLILFIVLGVFFFLAAVVLGLFMLREYRRRKLNNYRKSWQMTSFHLGEFNEANIAKGLTSENLIGSGGAGLVYKIVLGRRTGETIAVKKIWNSRKMDSKLEKEFQAEVQILGSIRHANIVKLLCCISSSNSKLLVYEFMNNGSLDAWLHSKCRARVPPAVSGEPEQPEMLDWPMRLAIAVGVAKGLCYMHHDCSPPILHRDVKASNILLDSEFNAKIADFGLARMLVKAGEPESVSVIAGSFGYIAPECGWSRKVNEKVDIFSFGVVLLELTTGREANHGDEHSCLADWAWKKFKEGDNLINLIEEKIRDPSYIDEIELVLRLGIICTGRVPEHRPSMKEVLQVLQRCEKNFENRWRKSPEGGEYDVAPLVGVKHGGDYSDDMCV